MLSAPQNVEQIISHDILRHFDTMSAVDDIDDKNVYLDILHNTETSDLSVGFAAQSERYL